MLRERRYFGVAQSRLGILQVSGIAIFMALLACGCGGKANAPKIIPAKVVPPPDQIVLKLYILGWRQIATGEALPAGFRIKGARVVSSDSLEMAAGHSFTADGLREWGDQLSAGGSPVMYGNPVLFSTSGSEVGSRDSQELQYLKTWRFMPKLTLPQYDIIKPGLELRMTPERFEQDKRTLVRADLRMTAVNLQKHRFADEFSKASPALDVDLPHTETMNVSGAVLVENGCFAVLAHYVGLRRPEPGLPAVFDHIFYIVGAEQTDPHGKPSQVDPSVPRMFPGQDGTMQWKEVPPRMAGLTLRWDMWSSEKNAESAEKPESGIRKVSESDIEKLLNGIPSGEAESQMIGLSLAEGNNLELQFGAARTWAAGFGGGQAEPTAFREIWIDHGLEGIRLGVNMLPSGKAAALSLAGIIGGPMQINGSGEMRTSLRPDAASDDVEKYFLQTCTQQVADIGVSLPVEGSATWRITPPWRRSDPANAAAGQEHLLLIKAEMKK